MGRTAGNRGFYGPEENNFSALPIPPATNLRLQLRLSAGALTGATYKSAGARFWSLSLNSTHISNLVGVKPALAAATFVSGLSGIWSFP